LRDVLEQRTMTATTLIPTRRLGRSGMDVSVLGFGGAVVGITNYLRQSSSDASEDDAQAVETVVSAVRSGINYFDTAPGYGAGRSETLIGRALEPYRDDVYIATKVGVHRDDDPAKWTDTLQSSLDRLHTDHIDLLQLHGNTWTDESVDWVLNGPGAWLQEVSAKGLTKAVGITAEAPSGALETLLRSGIFDVLQIAYSVIYQDACDYQREPFGVIPLAKSLDLGVTTMRTTTSGVFQRLLHSEFPELDSARLSRLAIKFVLSTKEVDCALVGMSKPSEVSQNAALAADEYDRLDLRKLHDFFGGWPDARLDPAAPQSA
jgi:aryl-alcohol dehydrogenase-like predicted oxidoreductase